MVEIESFGVMSEEDKKKLEEIVLYHGSLDELNSRCRININKKYDKFFLVECPFFMELFEEEYKDRALFKVKYELRKRGFDGLVNLRTSFSPYEDQDFSSKYYLFEGTPIVRVNEH